MKLQYQRGSGCRVLTERAGKSPWFSDVFPVRGKPEDQTGSVSREILELVGIFRLVSDQNPVARNRKIPAYIVCVPSRNRSVGIYFEHSSGRFRDGSGRWNDRAGPFQNRMQSIAF